MADDLIVNVGERLAGLLAGMPPLVVRYPYMYHVMRHRGQMPPVAGAPRQWTEQRLKATDFLYRLMEWLLLYSYFALDTRVIGRLSTWHGVVAETEGSPAFCLFVQEETERLFLARDLISATPRPAPREFTEDSADPPIDPPIEPIGWAMQTMFPTADFEAVGLSRESEPVGAAAQMLFREKGVRAEAVNTFAALMGQGSAASSFGDLTRRLQDNTGERMRLPMILGTPAWVHAPEGYPRRESDVGNLFDTALRRHHALTTCALAISMFVGISQAFSGTGTYVELDLTVLTAFHYGDSTPGTAGSVLGETETGQRHLLQNAAVVEEALVRNRGGLTMHQLGLYPVLEEFATPRGWSYSHRAQSMPFGGATGAAFDKSVRVAASRGTIVLRLKLDKLKLAEGQSRPRFCVWMSHHLSAAAQPSNDPGDPLTTMLSLGRTRVSEVVAVGDTVELDIVVTEAGSTLDVGTYNAATLWVSLVVEQTDGQNAFPRFARRGAVFFYLHELTSTLEQEAAGLRAVAWEGPLDSAMNIVPATMETQTDMTYVRTAAVTAKLTRGFSVVEGDVGVRTSRTPPGTVLAKTKPRSLLSARSQKIVNKCLLDLLHDFVKRHEAELHSILYVGALPGTNILLGTCLLQRPPATPLDLYEAHLRHELWRRDMPAADFERAVAIAMDASHPLRLWAFETVLWVVSMFLTPFNSFIYNTDVLEKRGIEHMINVMIYRRADCEDFSEGCFLHIRRLNALPLSHWRPLALVQNLLGHYVATHCAMTTHSGALSGEGTDIPTLHMTNLNIPKFWIEGDETADAHLRAILRPFICEGTGFFQNALANPRLFMPDGEPLPAPIVRGLAHRETVRSFVNAASKGLMGSPEVPATGHQDVAWPKAHPFYRDFVQICSPEFQTDDMYLGLYSGTAGQDGFPSLADVMSGDRSKFHMRASAIEATQLRALMHQVAEHVQPPPTFPHTEPVIPPKLAAAMHKLPMSSLKFSSTAGAAAASAPRTDAEILAPRAITFVTNLEQRRDVIDQIGAVIAQMEASAGLKPLIRSIDSDVWNPFGPQPAVFEVRVTF